MSTATIMVDRLSKSYRIGQLQSGYGTLRESLAHAGRRVTGKEHKQSYEEIWALKDVSFEVEQGEVLGVIGRNGAGKSTLLKLLTRITTPTSGQALIHGRVGSLLEVGTGFHPELTGRENIYLNGAILGMRRREITRKLPEIIDFAGVSTFMDTPVKRYSSGMYVRLAFSVAAHLDPEILLVDEVLSVGDAEFQKRCLGRMEEFSSSGRTVVFVSHQMQTLARLCDRAILLDGGEIVRDGSSDEVVAYYLQSVSGTPSRRTWPDLETAPGNEHARLREVRVVDEHGELADSVDVRAAGRHRDHVHRPQRRRRAVSEDQGLRPRGRHGVQRSRHHRRLGRCRGPRGLHVHGVDTRQLPQRGPVHRGRRRGQRRCEGRHVQAPPSHRDARGRVLPRPRPR